MNPKVAPASYFESGCPWSRHLQHAPAGESPSRLRFAEREFDPYQAPARVTNVLAPHIPSIAKRYIRDAVRG